MVKVSAVRHVRGFDVARPLSISVMLAIVACGLAFAAIYFSISIEKFSASIEKLLGI